MYGWEDIKCILKEQGVGCVYLIPDRDHCWVCVKMLMAFELPYKDRNFMTTDQEWLLNGVNVTLVKCYSYKRMH
jgi:hypothetical protein